jgi:hypothetical protein
MSEEQVTDPILTNDLTDTAPDEPLIPTNEYNVTVVKMEDGSSERTGSKCVNIQLRHLGPVTSTTGEVLQTRTDFMRIWITPTEKMTKGQIERNLKKFQLACGIKSGPFCPYSQYVGKNLRVKIGMSKVTDEYPDQRNEVKGVIVP